MHRAKPVSYTHLDVYKRQAMMRTAPAGRTLRFITALSARLTCPNNRPTYQMCIRDRLYVDGACSEASAEMVKEHLTACAAVSYTHLSWLISSLPQCQVVNSKKDKHYPVTACLAVYGLRLLALFTELKIDLVCKCLYPVSYTHLLNINRKSTVLPDCLYQSIFSA